MGEAAVKAGETAPGDADSPGLPTLADRVSWLIRHAHPAGRGPYSISEACFLIHEVTGEQISHTTIWKLRNGQQDNPQMRVISALACTFGVEPGFFFDDYDPAKLRLMQEQAEMVALVRGANITAAEFRSLLGLDAEGRQPLASPGASPAPGVGEHDPGRGGTVGSG
jgi:transcriptional regulator with XRE-family HTH domain